MKAGYSWSSVRSGRLIASVAVAIFASITLQVVDARAADASGREVVDKVCAACHATGVKGAPKIGDERAWAPLASRGLTSLTESALKGIRQMPSHGGSPGLSDVEIERAITHMVNLSGGRWVEPISGVTPAVERKGKEIVEARCSKCHQAGVNGAPRIGDRAAWIPRLRQGFDFAVRSAIHGHGPMPPRGGVADLTDLEIRAAVTYMVNPTGVAARDAPSTPLAVPDPNRKIVDGTEIYLGIVSAETLRAQHPKDDKESRMHGGIPSGRYYYHVNISLFDAKTRAVITEAQVEARVAEPVAGGETKKLEPMTLGNLRSYGNYFRMASRNPYTITVRVQKPGTPRSIEATFEHRHY